MQTKEQHLERIAKMFGEQETDLIGKRVKVTDDGSEPFIAAGEEGTVVLVDDAGFIWLDTGPDGFDADGQVYTVWCGPRVDEADKYEVIP